MKQCTGFSDWLSCIKCESLCSTDCPVERSDIEELLSQITIAEDIRSREVYGWFGSGPVQ